MENKTTEQRKQTLLNFNELSLAVEGRDVNLRIFIDKPKLNNIQHVYFRLDCYNQYSVPLSTAKLNYLEKPHEACTVLNDKFGFNGATLDNLDEILEITKSMKYRKLKSW